MESLEELAADILPYRSRTLRVGRHSMRYLDEGPATPNAPVLLCIHGNPTWSFYYRRVVERFSKTHRVIAVDHIGCGRSDKPGRDQFGYRLANHRDNLVTLIDELKLDAITLLAHDWGGAIGLSALHRRIDQARGIILLNTGAFPPPYIPLRIAACRWPVVGTLGVRGMNLFARAAITMAMSQRSLSNEAKSGLLAPYDNWSNRVAIDAFVRDIPMTSHHATRVDLEQLERSLPDFHELPITLIWGMRDWCFREECLRRFESVWPHATVHRLPDTGHYVLEDNPEETLQHIAAHFANVGSEGS